MSSPFVARSKHGYSFTSTDSSATFIEISPSSYVTEMFTEPYRKTGKYHHLHRLWVNQIVPRSTDEANSSFNLCRNYGRNQIYSQIGKDSNDLTISLSTSCIRPRVQFAVGVHAKRLCDLGESLSQLRN